MLGGRAAARPPSPPRLARGRRVSLTMSIAEREEFLAGLHVGVLSVDDPGSGPLAIPVWYSYVPGGTVNVITGGQSVKAGLLRAAGRFSLCVQNESMPYRYVSVEGPITAFDKTVSDEERRALAQRYLGAEGGGPLCGLDSGAGRRQRGVPHVTGALAHHRLRQTRIGTGSNARCAGVAQVDSNGPTRRPTASPQLLRRAGWSRFVWGSPRPACVRSRTGAGCPAETAPRPGR